jgi:hypothetical protein
MTLILGPTILLPKASKSPSPPKPTVLVFILLFVVLKSFFEFKVFVMIVGCLLKEPWFVSTLFLLTEGYLFVG